MPAHFTSASYRTFGERYAEKMLELVEVDTNPVTSGEDHIGKHLSLSCPRIAVR